MERLVDAKVRKRRLQDKRRTLQRHQRLAEPKEEQPLSDQLDSIISELHHSWSVKTPTKPFDRTDSLSTISTADVRFPKPSSVSAISTVTSSLNASRADSSNLSFLSAEKHNDEQSEEEEGASTAALTPTTSTAKFSADISDLFDEVAKVAERARNEAVVGPSSAPKRSHSLTERVAMKKLLPNSVATSLHKTAKANPFATVTHMTTVVYDSHKARKQKEDMSEKIQRIKATPHTLRTFKKNLREQCNKKHDYLVRESGRDFKLENRRMQTPGEKNSGRVLETEIREIKAMMAKHNFDMIDQSYSFHNMQHHYQEGLRHQRAGDNVVLDMHRRQLLWIVVTTVINFFKVQREIPGRIKPLDKAAVVLQTKLIDEYNKFKVRRRRRAWGVLRRVWLHVIVELRIRIKRKNTNRIKRFLASHRKWFLVMSRHRDWRRRVLLCQSTIRDTLERWSLQKNLIVLQWDKAERKLVNDARQAEIRDLRVKVAAECERLYRDKILKGTPTQKQMEKERKRVLEFAKDKVSIDGKLVPKQTLKDIMEEMQDTSQLPVSPYSGLTITRRQRREQRQKTYAEKTMVPLTALAYIGAHTLSDLELLSSAVELGYLWKTQMHYCPGDIKHKMAYEIFKKRLTDFQAARREYAIKAEALIDIEQLKVTRRSLTKNSPFDAALMDIPDSPLIRGGIPQDYTPRSTHSPSSTSYSPRSPSTTEDYDDDTRNNVYKLRAALARRINFRAVLGAPPHFRLLLNQEELKDVIENGVKQGELRRRQDFYTRLVKEKQVRKKVEQQYYGKPKKQAVTVVLPNDIGGLCADSIPMAPSTALGMLTGGDANNPFPSFTPTSHRRMQTFHQRFNPTTQGADQGVGRGWQRLHAQSHRDVVLPTQLLTKHQYEAYLQATHTHIPQSQNWKPFNLHTGKETGKPPEDAGTEVTINDSSGKSTKGILVVTSAMHNKHSVLKSNQPKQKHQHEATVPPPQSTQNIDNSNNTQPVNTRSSPLSKSTIPPSSSTTSTITELLGSSTANSPVSGTLTTTSPNDINQAFPSTTTLKSGSSELSASKSRPGLLSHSQLNTVGTTASIPRSGTPTSSLASLMRSAPALPKGTKGDSLRLGSNLNLAAALLEKQQTDETQEEDTIPMSSSTLNQVRNLTDSTNSIQIAETVSSSSESGGDSSDNSSIDESNIGKRAERKASLRAQDISTFLAERVPKLQSRNEMGSRNKKHRVTMNASMRLKRFQSMRSLRNSNNNTATPPPWWAQDTDSPGATPRSPGSAGVQCFAMSPKDLTMQFTAAMEDVGGTVLQ